MTFLKYIGFTILGLVILAIGSVYVFSIQREISIKTINIEVAENLVIPIEEMDSQRKYYGGHGAGWGGGDIKNHIKFSYNDINYLHETPFILEFIKFYKNSFYLIYYDRETYTRKTTYRFYKSQKNGDFKEIEPTKFPKHLAIQNRFWSDNFTPEDLIGLDPEKLLGTPTAAVWYMIEGEPKTPDLYIDFIKQYKEKYITNRTEK